MQKINLGNYSELQKYLHDFEELKQNAIRKSNFNEHAINSVGDWVIHSRDCFNVLFAIGCERVTYSQGVIQYRDSYDCLFGSNGELCYEFMATSMAENNSGNKFSSLANNSHDLEYCDLCYNCHDCFGCVGLRNKSFCVFNVQYTQDRYWQTIDHIKTAMLAAGEYGEFFPPALSSFPYNASLVTNYQGYDNFDEARGYGYWIMDIPQDVESPLDAQVLLSSKLPADIQDTDDSILQKVILDEESNKKFRITSYELEFYRTFKLALPRLHPFVRMNQWWQDFDLRLRFFERPCSRCGKRMQTIYAPDRREKNIYCDECYQGVIA